MIREYMPERPSKTTDAKHRNAVTEVFSSQTGAYAYNYDDVGNMVQRNGDVLKYDAQNKLVEMNTTGGDTMKYVYDSGGMRIKKSQKSSGVVVYSFDGLYEIARTPGQAEKHTLYFKGLYGDIFSQLTRNDAALLSELREPQLPNFTVSQCSKKNSRSVTDLNKPVTDLNKSVTDLNKSVTDLNKSVTEALECDPTLSIVTYYKNKFNDYSRVVIVSAYNTVSKRESMFAMYGMILLLGYAIYLLQQNKRLVFAPTPLLLLAYMIVFTDCGNFNSTKKGEAPWLLLASGINKDTPSVDDASTSSTPGLSGSGGGTVSPVVPVTGMFFLHPDHLGSIAMISDGYGNVISGGNNGGKSSMNYKPYGEMNRTDSSGPDITRFKYTGQEEDKETGLLYYKARYYDPSLGRFLQADNLTFPDKPSGMNKYMYVDGNPVMFIDPDGHATCAPANFRGGGLWAGHYIGPGKSCAGFRSREDFTDIFAVNPKTSALTAWQLRLFRPDLVSAETATLYWIYNYVNHNPEKIAQSPADRISIQHDRDFNTSSSAHKNLRANATWITQNVRSIFNANDWQDVYNREFNATSKKYGDARGLVAGINTLGTRGSDIGVTILGTALFTLRNPYLAAATILAGNTREGQFVIRPGRLKSPCAKGCNFGSY
jgi:RHS repeat-associated protein